MKTTLAFLALSALPLFAADSAGPAGKFAQDFDKHWKIAKQLAIDVASAMPDADYGFKPNADEMSFGEQIVHIAQANYSYCAAASGGKSPFSKPAAIEKASAVKVLGESFDYCSGIVSGLSDAQADTVNEARKMSVRELLLGVMTHMAHHRGQAEVYLRVKGIKPPSYKF